MTSAGGGGAFCAKAARGTADRSSAGDQRRSETSRVEPLLAAVRAEVGGLRNAALMSVTSRCCWVTVPWVDPADHSGPEPVEGLCRPGVLHIHQQCSDVVAAVDGVRIVNPAAAVIVGVVGAVVGPVVVGVSKGRGVRADEDLEAGLRRGIRGRHHEGVAGVHEAVAYRLHDQRVVAVVERLSGATVRNDLRNGSVTAVEARNAEGGECGEAAVEIVGGGHRVEVLHPLNTRRGVAARQPEQESGWYTRQPLSESSSSHSDPPSGLETFSR